MRQQAQQLLDEGVAMPLTEVCSSSAVAVSTVAGIGVTDSKLFIHIHICISISIHLRVYVYMRCFCAILMYFQCVRVRTEAAGIHADALEVYIHTIFGKALLVPSLETPEVQRWNSQGTEP